MFIILNSLLTRLLIYVLLSSFSEVCVSFWIGKYFFFCPQFQLPLPVYNKWSYIKDVLWSWEAQSCWLLGSEAPGVSFMWPVYIFLLWGWHSGGQDWPLGNHGNYLAVLGRFITWHFVRFGIDELCYWQVISTGVNRLEVSKLVPASISVLKEKPNWFLPLQQTLQDQ